MKHEGIFEELEDISLDHWGRDGTHRRKQLALDPIGSPSTWALYTGLFTDRQRGGWKAPRCAILRYRKYAGVWQQYHHLALIPSVTGQLLDLVMSWEHDQDPRPAPAGPIPQSHEGSFSSVLEMTRSIGKPGRLTQQQLDKVELYRHTRWLTMAYLVRRRIGRKWSEPVVELIRYQKRRGIWHQRRGVSLTLGQAVLVAQQLRTYDGIVARFRPASQVRHTVELLTTPGRFGLAPGAEPSPVTADHGELYVDPGFVDLHRLTPEMADAVKSWEAYRLDAETLYRGLMPSAADVLVGIPHAERSPRLLVKLGAIQWQAAIRGVREVATEPAEVLAASLTSPEPARVWAALVGRQSAAKASTTKPRASEPASSTSCAASFSAVR